MEDELEKVGGGRGETMVDELEEGGGDESSQSHRVHISCLLRTNKHFSLIFF